MSLMLPCDRLDLGEFTRRNGHGLGGDRPVRGDGQTVLVCRTTGDN